jgi:hypothetical protein
MDAPGSAGLPGLRPKKEVTMTASLIVFVIIRIIMALLESKPDNATGMSVTVTGTGDGFHPAEFELRDHFMERCSD